MLLKASFSTGAAASLHHALQVTLQPESAGLAVTDQVSLPEPLSEVSFLLHDGLEPELLEPARGRLEAGSTVDGPVPLRRYRITFEAPVTSLLLSYAGTLHHPLAVYGEISSSRQSSPGLISREGVFLAGSSYWYPVIGRLPVSFSMHLELPPGWLGVSQGTALPSSTGWQENQPQEEIYLVAAPYQRYAVTAKERRAEVYLRKKDPALADRYLQATLKYIAMYESLLGPYPYTKFALVENFWESGYGMPSFTLLGPRVIRLPFILHTSYPHEILHNWWGNGVYIKPSSGNWSEGLTTYLSDHLLREQRGEGATYRRHTLQDYASYVTRKADFPLRQFRGNHGQVSQSIGYGKTLMLFHMLRSRLGDQLFITGLRRFYTDYRFQAAGWSELQQVFEKVSSQSLEAFFEQWLNRTGAPALELLEAGVTPTEEGYQTRIVLRQTQAEAPFQLQVPLFLELDGASEPELHLVSMNQRQVRIEIQTRQRPLYLSVDPRFDLFRHLDPGEIPGSLGQLFGANRAVAILPADAAPEVRQAYRQLAAQWQQRQPGLDWTWDTELQKLPGDRPVWVLGRENRFADRFRPLLLEHDMSLDQDSLALAIHNPEQSEGLLGLVQGDSPDAIAGLARKLPHYGRYGYTRFSGPQPSIRERGEWPVTGSNLGLPLAADGDRQRQAIPRHSPLTKIE
ncbi:MAG: M1 family aminopeptidase [Sedimenticola sp.]|nr:M1 family aminopeptidase [Sedimenticola sp.]